MGIASNRMTKAREMRMRWLIDRLCESLRRLRAVVPGGILHAAIMAGRMMPPVYRWRIVVEGLTHTAIGSTNQKFTHEPRNTICQ